MGSEALIVQGFPVLPGFLEPGEVLLVYPFFVVKVLTESILELEEELDNLSV